MANTTPAHRHVARYPRTSAIYPCVFESDYVREVIDPLVKADWAKTRSDKPKWGDLRTTFRQQHCRAINPYGSGSCPGTPQACGGAFLAAVRQSLFATNAHAYFIKIARSTGAERADLYQSKRDRMRTDEQAEEADESRMGSPDREGLRTGPAPGVAQIQQPAAVLDLAVGKREGGVRSPLSRPASIGSVLGSFDLRPRPGPDDHEEEGS